MLNRSSSDDQGVPATARAGCRQVVPTLYIHDGGHQTIAVDDVDLDDMDADPVFTDPVAEDESSGASFEMPDADHHIRLRWASRNSARDVDVRTGWRRGVPVELPDYGYQHARLYELAEPHPVVLLETAGSLDTVLYADSIHVVDDHLETCDECGNRYTTTDEIGRLLELAGSGYTVLYGDHCHWCRGPHPRIDDLSTEARIC